MRYQILSLAWMLLAPPSFAATSSLMIRCEADLIGAPDLQVSPLLRAALAATRPFVISAAEAQRLSLGLGLSPNQLLIELLPLAQSFAVAPISDFHVGAAARAQGSGDIVLGVNVEFAGQALNQGVHAEQFATALALSHGIRGLEAIAVSAMPCGHCRQWLNELPAASGLAIFVPHHPAMTLGELLPYSFGPADLGQAGALLNHHHQTPLALEHAPGVQDLVVQAALQAAQHAYSVYTKHPSAVALQTKDGTIYSGAYAENAAYNPSLSPLQIALVNMIAAGQTSTQIHRVVLVERTGASPLVSQEPATRALLSTVAPQASFETLGLQNSL